MPHALHNRLAGFAASLAIATSLLSAHSTRAAAPDPAAVAFFENKVRPLLVERCYKCHSAGEKVKGELHLDSRPGWQKGGENGPAVVPGDPDKSLLIKAVRYEDDDLRMPPKQKLSQAEIDVLTQWVKMGAPDPRDAASTVATTGGVEKKAFDAAQARKELWSLRPLAHVEPPAVKDGAWSHSPIDRFIKSKLEEKGIEPNPQADRRVLVRRAYFDLLGLPPTPEQVGAFVNDPSPDAYEKLVDELLASPAFGERWGRRWLDLARFAESHGFEHDYDRPTAYTYRDFVIKALNQDLPYDTFVKWQLAGDEYAPNDPLAVMATGFLAAGVHSTQITKNEVEKHRYDELDDVVATVGTSMLGLTVGCARCHDHKFDPIPAHDYYRLVSVFTTTVRSEVELDLDPAGDRKRKEAFDAAHAPMAAAVERFEREQLPARFERWVKDGKLAEHAGKPRWIVLEPSGAKAESPATLTRQADGSFLAGGINPDIEAFTFTVPTTLTGVVAVRVEALADPSLKKGGPGRGSNGNFALTDLKVSVAPKGSSQRTDVRLRNPRATFEQKGFPAAHAIDDNKGSGWAVDPQFGKPHAASFEFEAPVGHDAGSVLTIRLEFRNNRGHAMGRPRVSVATAAAATAGGASGGDAVPALDAPSLPQGAAEVLAHLSASSDRATALAAIEPVQRDALLRWYRTLDPAWRTLNDAAQAHLATAPKPSKTKALVCSEGLPPLRLHSQGADFLTETHFLKRGNPDMKDGVAAPGYLQILTTAPDQERRWAQQPPQGWRTSYRRRALAEWITDVEHGAGHLLARVIVNRLWQGHMGRGIVSTPSDFGTRGDPPSHPELLDFLATELIRNGWRLKPIHRQVMLSRAYQQTADVDPAKLRVDPDNRLVSRRPRRRLEAEAVRDNLLAVGGLLDLTMYGPGTLDESMRRRSIYFTVKRSKLVPMLQVFDWPDGLQGLADRATTTIAPQALLLMNNPQVRTAAAGLAKRVAPDGGRPPAEAVMSAHRMALGRDATPAEVADGAQFIAEQEASYLAEGKRDSRERALTDFCQTLMCLNEFVYVD